MCLLREYLSRAMGVGFARGESAVVVPLRWLFRYDWMDIMDSIPLVVTQTFRIMSRP